MVPPKFHSCKKKGKNHIRKIEKWKKKHEKSWSWDYDLFQLIEWFMILTIEKKKWRIIII